MTLQEIKYRFLKALPGVDIDTVNIVISGANYKTFNKLPSFREAIYLIEETGLFPNEVSSLKRTPIFQVVDDSINLDIHVGNGIVDRVSKLRELVESIIAALQRVLPEETAESIRVKLPGITSLIELSRFADKLQTIFDQLIVNDDIKGHAQIEYIEPGSIWIEISLGTVLAVKLIGKVAWSAAVVAKKRQEGKYFEQVVREKTIQNDVKEHAAAAFKTLVDITVQVEAKGIEDEFYKTKDPERLNRIKNSVNELADMIMIGTEVHSSLTASESVSNLFPNMKDLPSINTPKQLSEEKE